MEETVVVGEAVAGQAAKTLKQAKQLIAGLSSSTFDLMDCLHEISDKKYYAPKFNTFTEYAQSLDIKPVKVYYLVRIARQMALAGVSRAVYEPIGIGKLRAIARINILDQDGQVNPTKVDSVKDLIALAPDNSIDGIKVMVDNLQGLVGEEAFEWRNIKIKKSANAVVEKVFKMVRVQLGQTKNDEGIFQDASDGTVLEKICLDVLSDPNYAPVLSMLGKEPGIE